MPDISNVKKILIISLTNIGDIVLTFPVIDILRNDMPDAEISLVIGPKGKPLVSDNPNIKKVYIFDKTKNINGKFRFVMRLRQERFDMVVDLRNTWIPFILWPRYCTSPFRKRVKCEHIREKHLRTLKSVYDYTHEAERRASLYINESDSRYMEDIIKNDVGAAKGNTMVVGPSAADRGKRWNAEGFASVCDYVADRYNLKVVFVGDKNDISIVQEVARRMKYPSVNLSGRISLTQLAYLFLNCRICLTNDSAPMHLASYLDVPVIGLFGPSDPGKYAPWGKGSFFVKCNADVVETGNEVIDSIEPDDVRAVLDKMLSR